VRRGSGGGAGERGLNDAGDGAGLGEPLSAPIAWGFAAKAARAAAKRPAMGVVSSS
jgi:hypothetical protein